MAIYGSKWNKPMERKIQVPISGTDVVSLPHKVHDGKCADSLNMWVSPSGQFEARPGTIGLLKTLLPKPIKAIAFYPKSNKLLVASGSHLYLVDKTHTRHDATATDLGALNSITDDDNVSIAIFCGDAFIASGGVLQKYDGDVLTNLAVNSYSCPAPESAGCLAVRGNRLWVGQHSGSKLWHSGINDPLDWGRDPASTEGQGEDLNGGSFNVDKDDGGIISGISNFASDLVIFKAGARNSIHKVTGNSSGAEGDIKREQLAEGASALNHKLSAVVDRDILFSGVAGVQSLQITDQLGNIASVPVSLEMKPIYDQFQPQCMAFAPVFGVLFLVLGDNHVITYQRERQAWYPWRFEGFTPCFVDVVEDKVYIGSTEGQIYLFDVEETTDDEIPFSKNFTTPAMSFSASTRQLRMAKFFMVYSSNENGILNVDARLSYGTDYVHTQNVTSESTTNSQWDASGWDTLEAQWDGSTLNIARVRIGIQGDNIQLRISSMAPLKVYDMWCHGAYLSKRR